jgi:hypothetical protein
MGAGGRSDPSPPDQGLAKTLVRPGLVFDHVEGPYARRGQLGHASVDDETLRFSGGVSFPWLKSSSQDSHCLAGQVPHITSKALITPPGNSAHDPDSQLRA